MNESFLQLRQKAERSVAMADIDMSQLSELEIKNIIHDLEVHRIELEMQNDELQRANKELEQAKRKYAELFEFAPVGYLTLDRRYRITDANLTFAQLVGAPGKKILSAAFTDFICPDSQDMFHFAIGRLQDTYEKQTIAIQLKQVNDYVFWVHLQMTLRDGSQSYLVSVSDVTQQTQAEQEIAKLNNRIEAAMIAGNMAWWEMELPSGSIVFNENKAKMLGFAPEQFRHYQDFLDLVHPEDYENTIDACRRHITGEKDLYECEYRICTHENTFLWFHDIGRIVERDKERMTMVGIVTNITERKRAEAALKAALVEKEVLLKEIHHRVKNNMQTIASLLYKQQQHTDDDHARKVLDDSIQRVKSMALIHEQIYRVKNLSRINLAEYIRQLANKLLKTYRPKGSAITLTPRIEEVYLPVDASIPVALILNELIVNALKYAFPDMRDGGIEIECWESAGEITLIVRDNGVGLPDNFEFNQTSTLGLYLVHNLATRQLGGSIALHRKHPTEFVMKFKTEGGQQ